MAVINKKSTKMISIAARRAKKVLLLFVIVDHANMYIQRYRKIIVAVDRKNVDLPRIIVCSTRIVSSLQTNVK